jgi:hypothetical protein
MDIKNLFIYSLTLLVKFLVVSLYIYINIYIYYFHLVSHSRTDKVPQPIFPNAPAQSHHSFAPVFLYNSFLTQSFLQGK